MNIFTVQCKALFSLYDRFDGTVHANALYMTIDRKAFTKVNVFDSRIVYCCRLSVFLFTPCRFLFR